MYITWFNEIGLNDLDLVGGKNASLGEMIQNMENLGINVPFGFAITTKAYDKFIQDNNLDEYINRKLKSNNNLNYLY